MNENSECNVVYRKEAIKKASFKLDAFSIFYKFHERGINISSSIPDLPRKALQGPLQ